MYEPCNISFGNQEVTVLRNLGLKFMSMILLDFQTFSFVREKQHSFCSFDFGFSIHRAFHQQDYIHSTFKLPVVELAVGHWTLSVFERFLFKENLKISTKMTNNFINGILKYYFEEIVNMVYKE